MLAFVVSLAGVLVVGGLLFLGGSLLLGRGETQPPAETDRSPVELPDDRPVVSGDIRALRISVAVRGYRMTEVDWLLDQFAETLDERDEQIAALRAELERSHHVDQVSVDQVSVDQVSHDQVSHDQVSHDQVSADQVDDDRGPVDRGPERVRGHEQQHGNEQEHEQDGARSDA